MLPPAFDLRDELQRHLGSIYAIDRELRGGGSARVVLATELALERRVVLKVLPPDVSRSVDGERFRREILIAARLQHPHLLPLLNAGSVDLEDGGELRWFSMPYIDGQSLRDRLQLGAVPDRDVLRLLRELASALAFAHSRGIVHRDIKPENVLLSGGASMLSDFGVAKALYDASTVGADGRRVTSVGMMLGTPAYMAPEQITSALVVDHRADLYAYGCVAYELLTGEPPLVRDSLRATLEAQVVSLPDPLQERRADVAPALATTVMRCLEKDPERRPASASEIVDMFDELATALYTSGAYRAAPAVDMAVSSQPSTPAFGGNAPTAHTPATNGTSAAPARAPREVPPPADTPVHSTTRSGLTMLAFAIAAVAIVVAAAWMASR